MNAEEAYNQTITSENNRFLNEIEIQVVLNLIKYHANNGQFKCNYNYDENIKEKLIYLGYFVSDMWKSGKWWYRTECMTISWDK